MSPLQYKRDNDTQTLRSNRSRNLSYRQVEALEKLIDVLEHNEQDLTIRPVVTSAPYRADKLSQSARLRSAHAVYGLSNLSEMKRVGVGAWIHRKYA
jgi:hypothetical protein